MESDPAKDTIRRIERTFSRMPYLGGNVHFSSRTDSDLDRLQTIERNLETLIDILRGVAERDAEATAELRDVATMFATFKRFAARVIE